MTGSNKRIIYLATNNPNKRREILEIIAPNSNSLFSKYFELRLSHELHPKILWEETGQTFYDNALIKAQAVKKFTKSSVLADDSGIMVDAIDGAPGIYSSRFAGRDGDDAANNEKLFHVLRDVPTEKRGAQFVCCLVYIDEKEKISPFEGIVRGRIAFRETGKNGFGYDPLFIPDGYTVSMAELSDAEKNSISHRGNASRAFLKAILTSVQEL